MDSVSHRIKLTLEYDGAAYFGWQQQREGPSIQSELEAAVKSLTGETLKVDVAGRTDAGVHAQGQVCAFTTTRDLPLNAYLKGLSSFLPLDIAVKHAEEVPLEFDPRRHAKGKRYRYRILNARRLSPLRRRTHWQLFAPLDLEGMQAGAQHLLGRHDFSAFRAANCQALTTEREVWKVDVVPHVDPERPDELEIVVTVEGTAFLRHMVRNIAGTLVDVGRRRHPSSWVADVLASKDRTLSGQTAPAHGLTLIEVFYGERPR